MCQFCTRLVCIPQDNKRKKKVVTMLPHGLNSIAAQFSGTFKMGLLLTEQITWLI